MMVMMKRKKVNIQITMMIYLKKVRMKIMMRKAVISKQIGIEIMLLKRKVSTKSTMNIAKRSKPRKINQSNIMLMMTMIMTQRLDL